jgi:hypothetical protein
LRKILNLSGKFLVTIAAAWAVGASLYILFSPVTISGVTGTVRPGSSEVVDVFTRQQSWFEAQGLRGVLVLVLFSALYLLAIWIVWRGKYRALLILSVFAIALSIVTGFSIGAAYLPAALGLFVGALMLVSTTFERAL